jgi:uncharacterized protein YnzC (UPF0291/DUF896 family)
MEQYKIDRINELSKLARQRALTEEELSERAALRTEYLAAIRMSLESQLENTYIVDEKGNKRKVEKKGK